MTTFIHNPVTVQEQLDRFDVPLQSEARDLLIKAMRVERAISRRNAIIERFYKHYQEEFLFGMLFEMQSVGGSLWTGGATRRGPVMSTLGSGRLHANDGVAYQSSLEEAFHYLVDKVIMTNSGYRLTTWENVEVKLGEVLGYVIQPLSEWCSTEVSFDLLDTEMEYWVMLDLDDGEVPRPDSLDDHPARANALAVMDSIPEEFIRSLLNQLLLRAAGCIGRESISNTCADIVHDGETDPSDIMRRASDIMQNVHYAFRYMEETRAKLKKKEEAAS